MIPFLFDRRDLVALLRKRVDGFRSGYRQNLALIGPAGMGKSTLVREFLFQEARRESLLLSLYLEIGPDENAAEWISRFAKTALYAVLQLGNTHSFPARMPELLEEGSALVPRTAALVRRVMAFREEGRLAEAYDLLWDLPDLITQETGHWVLLVLDEFHRLRDFPVKEPFQSLGRKIMVQPTTLYLLVSSEPQAAHSILQEGLALLFGKFESVEAAPLTSGACRSAVRGTRPEEPVDPFDEYLLIDLAQGSPHRLNLLLERWRATSCVADLLEALFLRVDSPLRLDFEQRLRFLSTRRNPAFCLQVLESVAAGIHRLPHLAIQLQRSVPQVAAALRLLQEGRLVSKESSFYRIPDRLFQVWVITAYPVSQGMALMGPDPAEAYFRRAIRVWMQGVRQALDCPLERQLNDLLQLWDDEQVELEGRKVLLPRFRQVERVPGPFEGTSLLGRPMKRIKGGWWVVPWKGALDEAQARRLVQQIRDFSPLKEYRKLLIGADPAEVNARLVLQEAKIRFWDLTTLNQLLDLYGLTRLPVPEEADISPGGTVALQERKWQGDSGSSADSQGVG